MCFIAMPYIVFLCLLETKQQYPGKINEYCAVAIEFINAFLLKMH